MDDDRRVSIYLFEKDNAVDHFYLREKMARKVTVIDWSTDLKEACIWDKKKHSEKA